MQQTLIPRIFRGNNNNNNNKGHNDFNAWKLKTPKDANF